MLRRLPLQIDESLSSLLIRLSRANHYDTFTILSSQILSDTRGKNLVKDKLSCPHQPYTYEHIAKITNLEVFKLYRATPHRFARIITRPDDIIDSISFSDSTSAPLLSPGIADKQLHSIEAAQFCPTCLKKALYHRLIWLPLAVSVCLEHKCLLLANCYSCGKKISVRDVVVAQCSTCKSNLMEAETQSLDGDEFGLFSQHLIQSWLMNNLTPQSCINLVPNQPPQIIYRIIDGLRQVLITLENLGQSYLHRIDGIPLELSLRQKQYRQSPYESYCLYTTACKGLMNWPRGFYEFLQAYRIQRTGSQSIQAGPKADLGNLYTQWLQDYWQHPSFGFVQEAFEEYFANQYWLSSSVARTKFYQKNLHVAGEFSFINIAEAARITGRTTNQIKLLIKTERLAHHNAESSTRLKFVKRTELLEVCQNWSEGISRLEAATWLGVTEKMVTAMVTTGLLQAEHDTANSFPQWLFSKTTVLTLLENVSKHVQFLSADDKVNCNPFLNLTQAARQVFVIGVDATGILQRVAEGKLHAYHEMSTELHLGWLFFNRRDLEKCVEDIKAENGWMSREEVTKTLGVKDVTLTRWVKVGLLPLSTTYASAQYFSKSTVEHFINDHVTSDAAAQILSIGVFAVQKWTREGRLSESCVSGPNIDGHHSYLFHKEKLMQWRQERLTFGEAVKLLGVSKTTLHRWTKEKKIEPLAAMGGKQRWFSRQVIVELAKI